MPLRLLASTDVVDLGSKPVWLVASLFDGTKGLLMTIKTHKNNQKICVQYTLVYIDTIEHMYISYIYISSEGDWG